MFFLSSGQFGLFVIHCQRVHCRTGSSEIALVLQAFDVEVHCRTGSSEKWVTLHLQWFTVHCRTGSSETWVSTDASQQ